MPDVLAAGLTALVVAGLVMTATTLEARRRGVVVVVDVAWGLVFVAIAIGCAVVGLARDAGDSTRTVLLVALVAAWGLRLAWHLRGRASGDHEDPRYEKMLGGRLDEVGLVVAIRKVFAVQGVAAVVIALPVVVGTATDDVWWPIVVVGALVWVVGLVFEAVGDAQLASYRARPRDERPQVLDTGLWRYTRHPNYFGDACVWWGIWLVGGLASGWVAGLATVLAPLAMTWFLSEATGAKLLEKTMMQRPGYPEYAARTSRFIPRAPRRSPMA
ncbi:DUF1295 domain-containing protein [Nocardioides caeni]|uniref:DUF1295 domain-containing protein n=1 Tax=Nocardioides caeni TaxID=574700 RepID=A0A4S8N354_9ACTN|nr:DUF1295 domain-containing protein [Nocardioides caeni]THV09164.1 DUF1295 domain-containing protein [Nocardioides caeni]